MTIAKLTKNIPVSASRIWEVISDFGNIKNYHPFVNTSPVLGNINRGIGATRRCEFYDSTSIVEKVIDWDEGKSYSVELSESSMPLKKAIVIMRVSPVKSNVSEVTIEMDYIVKFGVLGKMMGIVMVRPMMKRMFNKVLNALEQHSLTGNKIGENGVQLMM